MELTATTPDARRSAPEDVLLTAAYVEARRRVFRQLAEAVIYEQVCAYSSVPAGGGRERFVLKAQAGQGKPVFYICEGTRRAGFGRIRLSGRPVRRMVDEEEQEAVDVALFIQEIAPHCREEALHAARFTLELEQTLLKEAQARRAAIADGDAARRARPERSFAELEGDVIDGHPYHPCFKSRIGFDLDDNASYGPEFHPRLRLMWLAVRRDLAVVADSPDITYEQLVREQAGEAAGRWRSKLEAAGLDAGQYIWMPVHPWQWRECVLPGFFRYMADGGIVPLGEGDDDYLPQQSLRTLSNGSHPLKWNVKLSLGITNTSAVRILGTHHVTNAPVLSAWLANIVRGDPYLSDRARLVLLREAAGASFRYEHVPEPLRASVYGAIGVIWRESVNAYTDEGEQAVPYTALCHVRADGKPFIDPWVRRQGVERFTAKLLAVTLHPLLHLLYAHGVAMEAHGQNMALLHKDGEPTRVALRDLPGGVRFYTRRADDPLRPTGLRDSDPLHPNSYSTSPMETDNTDKIRNFLLDSLLQISLAELSNVLEEHYGLKESRFWLLAAEAVRDYQRMFPELAPYFSKYDWFVETIDVGQLTRRRLFGEHVARNHAVRNPLYSYK